MTCTLSVCLGDETRWPNILYQGAGNSFQTWLSEELTRADEMITTIRCSLLLVFDTKSKIGLIFSEIVTSKVLTIERSGLGKYVSGDADYPSSGIPKTRTMLSVNADERKSWKGAWQMTCLGPTLFLKEFTCRVHKLLHLSYHATYPECPLLRLSYAPALVSIPSVVL
jgi:hypothetical protein